MYLQWFLNIFPIARMQCWFFCTWKKEKGEHLCFKLCMHPLLGEEWLCDSNWICRNGVFYIFKVNQCWWKWPWGYRPPPCVVIWCNASNANASFPWICFTFLWLIPDVEQLYLDLERHDVKHYFAPCLKKKNGVRAGPGAYLWPANAFEYGMSLCKIDAVMFNIPMVRTCLFAF